MNRKFATIFAIVCIAAALGALGSVAYRVLEADRMGREAAKADFEGLRSVLAYVKSQADLSDPSLRARLASRYETSSGLLLVDVYEQGSAEVWRIPADSPYLARGRDAKASPEPIYPPTSTLLLSAPLKGDSSGKLAVDALYTSLPQAAVFEAFRDALIGLGAFLAIAVLVLAVAFSRSDRAAKKETGADAKEGEISAAAAELAAAGAQYQFETLNPGGEKDEDFDIPIMGGEAMTAGLSIKTAPEELPEEAAQDKPEGLYSPASGLGWESYMRDRLDAELSRSASFEQDLSLVVFAYDGLSSGDADYAKISATIKELFSFRDLAFERVDGFAIILPNSDSVHAMRMAEEFNKKLVYLAAGDYAELGLLPMYMGISSRAGRLVDAQRLVEEAEAALERARNEKDTHIVAFKPDPDKYRLYLASKGV
jgi:GGDEF domain-containing protein